ncbi:MAG: UDP-2,3-diacylglucosamine diphosphatase [Sulfurovum sp.]|nr:UDP-2,3-diacylglucosamine diphosphatase [Sulfurovum sp.]
MKYRSIFVSDIHLGTKFAQADMFLDFLKDIESDNLYLVGDIIDGWAMKRKYRWKQSHSDVVQKILRKARKGTNVYFITGNHDEFLRDFVPIFLGDNLTILNEVDYNSLDGKRYYVTHGDFFDSITMTKKWLALMGDIGYDLLLNMNQSINYARRKFGIRRYWSLSKYVKDSVKSSVSFINDFESILAQHAKHKNYDGIICGHIHKAEIKMIEGIEYKNCGDWVESCTALVETIDGEWEIVDWLHHGECNSESVT